MRVRLPERGRYFEVPGRAVWINSAAGNKKPVGFGLRFDRRQARFLRLAVSRG